VPTMKNQGVMVSAIASFLLFATILLLFS